MSNRFAVLAHDWPFPHRDLFLERDGALLAWRLPAGGAVPLPAVANASHRLHYLDYEGPVPGDRGTVACEDRGPLEWIATSIDCYTFRLSGTRWDGRFELRRGAAGEWWFRHDPEAEA
jgi:hypothetical protein